MVSIDEIDEIIAHAREVARINRKQYKNCPADRRDSEHQTCEQCAEEHEQLAELLEELKKYKEHEFGVLKKDGQLLYKQGILDGYDKAIDDFVNACKEDILCQSFGLHINGIERIAEQLKAGGEKTIEIVKQGGVRKDVSK